MRARNRTIRRSLRGCAGVLTVALCWQTAPAPRAQGSQQLRTTIHIPDATEKGEWEGTWFHVSREARVALWMRETDGMPDIRVQYFGVASRESLLTDWSGQSEYQVRGAPGTFALRLTGRDEGDILHAELHWDLQFADSGRTDDSKLTIYRIGDGRQLTVVFEDMLRKIRRGQNVQEVPIQQAWTFRKISKRHILWDELPF